MTSVTKGLSLACTLLALSLLAPACGATPSDTELIQAPVIFGTDNRVEFASLTDPNFIRYANATAILFGSTALSCSGSTCSLNSLTPYSLGGTPTGTRPLCSNVRFRLQQKVGVSACSAFLVGPDLVATAGHCVGAPPNTPFPPCGGNTPPGFPLKVIFGFAADASGNTPASVPSSQVYTCTGTPLGAYIVDSNGNPVEDWAIMKMDRIVQGRVPLVPRYSGQVQNTELGALGHPENLPLKMARQSFVKIDNPADAVHFWASSDVFPGSSGGPVVNLATGVAEGIVTNAPPGHYVDASDGSGGLCAALNVCSDASGCPVGGFDLYTRMPFAARHGKVPLHRAIVSAIL